MKFAKATEQYEAWLGRHLRIIPEDLTYKHQQMRLAPFPFLRATYYRWAQIWDDVCGALARGPRVLAVGDLHVENFGTWRDVEGRLIWGINDFDEASRLPYTNDLIRLATSALIAQIPCDLKAGHGRHPERLQRFAQSRGPALRAGRTSRRSPHYGRRPPPRSRAVWAKLHALPDVKEQPPAGAIKAILRMMPERSNSNIASPTASPASAVSGRERYVAIGRMARRLRRARSQGSRALSLRVGQGKRVLLSILYEDVLDHSVRCRDPFVRVHKRWIVRRLAPDCSRIELSALPKERDEFRLLYAMGWETANIHLGSVKPAPIMADLEKKPRTWLLDAARKMEKAVRADFEDYSTR